jgi:hypothetical protein
MLKFGAFAGTKLSTVAVEPICSSLLSFGELMPATRCEIAPEPTSPRFSRCCLRRILNDLLLLAEIFDDVYLVRQF